MCLKTSVLPGNSLQKSRKIMRRCGSFESRTINWPSFADLCYVTVISSFWYYASVLIYARIDLLAFSRLVFSRGNGKIIKWIGGYVSIIDVLQLNVEDRVDRVQIK